MVREEPNAPSATVAVPGERVVVTEEQLNEWLTRQEAELRPARDPRAEIEPTGVTVRFRVLAFEGAYRARPEAEDGRIVLREARLEGPLGLGLDSDVVTARLQQALNQQLLANGVRVTSVQLEHGQIIVEIAR